MLHDEWHREMVYPWRGRPHYASAKKEFAHRRVQTSLPCVRSSNATFYNLTINVRKVWNVLNASKAQFYAQFIVLFVYNSAQIISLSNTFTSFACGSSVRGSHRDIVITNTGGIRGIRQNELKIVFPGIRTWFSKNYPRIWHVFIGTLARSREAVSFKPDAEIRASR